MPAQGTELQRLRDGLWRWERRHPEWHPGRFGAQVASYLVKAGGVTLLIDPLTDGEGDPLLKQLDRLVTDQVLVLISVPYHTRSAESLWRRYRERDCLIHGSPLVAKRLSEPTAFTAVAPGDEVGGVARWHPLGRPRRSEMPIEVYSQRALVFGDAVVGAEGGLRVWESPLSTESRRRW